MRAFLFLFLTASLLQAKLPPPGRSFDTIEKNYRVMLDDPARNRFRHNYIRHIRHFSTFNKIYINRHNPRREDALYYIATIYSDLAFASGRKSDFIIAFNRIGNFARRTPRNDLRLRTTRVINRIRKHAEKAQIKQILTNSIHETEFGRSLTEAFALVSHIRQFKNSITVHTNMRVKYHINTAAIREKRQPPSNQSKKIIIEIQNARLDTKTYQKPFRKTSSVKNLRVFQHNAKLVRIEFITSKNLFPLITETMTGKKINFAVRPRNVAEKARKELFKKVKVLLDPGHGGKDPGTVNNGIREKNITLAISKILGKSLKNEGMEVFYTRQTDVTLSLNERADIAKKISPDIFISIHTNSSRNRKARGIETYYFDVRSDRTTMEIAMRENLNSGHISDLDFILQDLTMSKNFLDGGKLAARIHHALIKGISAKTQRNLRNRGTRGGPFYILYRTGVPSILIETGFLSNRHEARKLKSTSYQKLIAKHITSGLKMFIRGL